MPKKTKIKILSMICGVVLITLIGVGLLLFGENNTKFNNEYASIDRNQIEYQKEPSITELKNSFAMTGEDTLYEIQEEQDGRKTLVVKASLNYQVAFASMIEKQNPESIKKAQQLVKEKHPQNNGVWVEESAREEFLNRLNETMGASYQIDEQGYLKVKEQKQNQPSDIILQGMIQGEKQYLITILGQYAYVDNKTGQIIENPYEDMNSYQTYDYVQEENKLILFLTENRKGRLENTEIIQSFLNLCEELSKT